MTGVQTVAAGLLLWHPDRQSPNGSGTCPFWVNRVGFAMAAAFPVTPVPEIETTFQGFCSARAND
jgi:hypothetical protein